jgi:glycerol-3-phosphate dehydrogenase
MVNGVTFQDAESGQKHRVYARCVINATGAFCDVLQRQDEPGSEAMIAPSQGVHIVLDRSFLPGGTAIMVPHTRDGRVMFAIPWHNHVVVGTTDTPIQEVRLDPVPQPGEVDFILETARDYLARRPDRSDILSVFTGIRPLVNTARTSTTAALSREHTITISKSGLLTIAGGKWTTYRKMAEDCLEHAIVLARLEERPCITQQLAVHGAGPGAGASDGLAVYGTDAAHIEQLSRESPQQGARLNSELPIIAAQVIWAVRQEMARQVEDVLARRTRALFLNARAAIEMAPEVARLMAAELGQNSGWQETQLRNFASTALAFLNPLN